MPIPAFLAAAEASPPYLAYALFIVGMALMLTELFIPGMVAGLAGLLLMVAGIVLGFQQGGTTVGAILAVAGVVSLPAFLIVWVKWIGPSLAITAKVEDDEQALESIHSLLGQQGVALTTLRPAGLAQIGDRRVDVVTDGEIIDKDTRIEAVEVRGNQVVVRAVRV